MMEQVDRGRRSRLKAHGFPMPSFGTMANLQQKMENPDSELITDYRDSLKTMACVEAAYEASAKGGVPLPE